MARGGNSEKQRGIPDFSSYQAFSETSYKC